MNTTPSVYTKKKTKRLYLKSIKMKSDNLYKFILLDTLLGCMVQMVFVVLESQMYDSEEYVMA